MEDLVVSKIRRERTCGLKDGRWPPEIAAAWKMVSSAFL